MIEGILFIFIHALICLAFFKFLKDNKIKIDIYSKFFIVALPIFGVVLTYILQFRTIKKDLGEEIEDTEASHEEEIINISERAKYTVPLEEALTVSSPRVRREMLMDIINDNPSEYIEVIRLAMKNDDTEVMHYATTAMVEISKSYDLRMQEMEKRYREDESVISMYCELLKSYIESGLVNGQAERKVRIQYIDLLKKKIELSPEKLDYIEMISSNMDIGEYEVATTYLDRMDSNYQVSEDSFMFRLRLYEELGDMKRMRELIKLAYRSDIYIRRENRDRLEYFERRI